MTKKNFKKWIIASLIRAVRTFAEVMLATIGTNYVRFNEVDWIGALSIGLTAFILTIIAALTGLPEVPEEEVKKIKNKK